MSVDQEQSMDITNGDDSDDDGAEPRLYISEQQPHDEQNEMQPLPSIYDDSQEVWSDVEPSSYTVDYKLISEALLSASAEDKVVILDYARATREDIDVEGLVNILANQNPIKKIKQEEMVSKENSRGNQVRTDQVTIILKLDIELITNFCRFRSWVDIQFIVASYS